MIYYAVVALFVFFFFFLLIDRLIIDLRRIPSALRIILTCLIFTILFKFSYGFPFWGLEYEDSYVAAIVAKGYLHSILPNSFVTEVISVGSFDSPLLMSQHGGHFITYPVVISFANFLFGTDPIVIDVLNALMAFAIMLIFSVMVFKNDSRTWILAPILYSAAPIINVFTNTHLIELFSSLLILSFIYSSFTRSRRKPDNLLALISFALAIMTKRDNLALCIFPITLCFIAFIRKSENLKPQICNVLLVAVTVIVYHLFYSNVINTEQVEAVAINQPTFSLQYFKILFPKP